MSIRRAQKSSIAINGKKGSSVIAGYGPGIDEMDLIQRVTVGAGGQAALDFTSIPQTYQHLQVRVVLRGDTASTAVEFRMLSGSGTVDTGSNYSNHLLYGEGSASYATGYASQAYMWLGSPPASTASANVFGTFIVDILDYASTSKNKTFRAAGGRDLNGSGVSFLSSGAWLSTSAINVVRLSTNAGNWAQYSTAALYGVKA